MANENEKNMNQEAQGTQVPPQDQAQPVQQPQGNGQQEPPKKDRKEFILVRAAKGVIHGVGTAFDWVYKQMCDHPIGTAIVSGTIGVIGKTAYDKYAPNIKRRFSGPIETEFLPEGDKSPIELPMSSETNSYDE